MKRYRPAMAVSVACIAIGPFVGEIRDFIKEAFPGNFVRIVGGAIALALVAAFASAAWRIRDRRLTRFGALALALALFAGYLLAFSTGIPDVDAVERFHFIQYGLVGALFYRAVRSAAGPVIVLIPLLCGTLVGIVDEWVQWLVPARSGDVRDIGLDAVAALCGVVFAFGLWPPVGGGWRMDAAWTRRACRLGAVAALAFAVFFHLAHLGYEVVDEETGTFRSYFTRDALVALARARGAAWAVDPPRRLAILAVEDFYLTEGGWHAQLRNAGYGTGDFHTAWKENRILEKYYDPFLDLHSFSRPDQVHRWPAAQRDEVAAKSAPTQATPYASPAGVERVVIRPTKPAFWTMALVVAGLLLWRSRGARPQDQPWSAQRQR